MTHNFEIIAIYQFVHPHWKEDEVKEWQHKLRALLEERQALGHILLAPEGINGTICAPRRISNRPETPSLQESLKQHFPQSTSRKSFSETQVFQRLRIRLKDSLIRLIVPEEHPGHTDTCVTPDSVGTYVQPDKWNDLLQDPECMVIDTRNDYEVEVGTFVNAIAPQTQSFGEFPRWMKEQLERPTKESQKGIQLPKKIAMFCTGGIRCERSTSWLQEYLQEMKHKYAGKDSGNDEERWQMPEVYHLQGGILHYLETVPEQKSMYKGECYVFDKRVAVAHGLQPSQRFTACFACRHVLNEQDRMHPFYEEGVCCGYCHDAKQDRRQRYQDRQEQLVTISKRQRAASC